MTVRELVARFPEIPADLHGEEVVSSFAERFGPLLVDAAKPSACAETHTIQNRRYLKLIGPMDIYRYGLTSREKVIDQLRALLEAYGAEPSALDADLSEEKA